MVSIAPHAGIPSTKITNLGSSDDREAIRRAKQRKTPLWVEFDLVGDTSWFEPSLEPWDKLERPDIDWTLADDILDLLGIDRPDRSDGNLPARVLAVLPLVYTLGVRRAQSEIEASEDDQVMLAPILGFSRPTDRLRTWQLRLNLAVVDGNVFTIRLPDARWPSDATEEMGEKPEALVIRSRYLPMAMSPRAHDVAAGIGFHQAATCVALVGKIRQRLLEYETGLMAGSRDVAQRGTGYGRLSSRFHELFRLSVRAQQIARSLERLREQFDVQADQRAMPIARRFAEAQLAADSLQVDVRRTSDGIASILSVQQLVVNVAQAAAAEAQEKTVREAQTASDRFQRRLTIVGAAVLIPALVAAVYGANVKLPGKNQPRGLAAMLFFMLGLGLLTWWALEAQDRRAWPRFTNLRAPDAVKDAYVHASLVAGVSAIILGVLTLAITGPELPAGTVARGLAGGFVTSLALGGLAWLAFYIVRRPATKQRAACRVAAALCGLVAAGGLVFTLGLF